MILTVDGTQRETGAGDGRSLLQLLREDLDEIAPKPACDEGVCGACTVLLDGVPVRACLTPAAEAEGHTLTTAAGLAGDGALHPVQDAFLAEGAFQCGYCTGGMILAAVALLAESPDPSPEEIRSALAGHVCRCGGYARIERAITRAAAARGSAGAAAAARKPVGCRAVGFQEFRPARPWDLTAAAEREYFDLLGDGLVVVMEPADLSAPAGGRGRGLASTGASAPDRAGRSWSAPAGGAWLHVGGEGAVTAFAGKVGMGQDNATALALIVAEELCAAPAAVRLALGDTDLCPWDIGTFGSRSLPGAGEDLAAAAAAARELLIGLAAQRLRVAPGQLRARGGAVHGPAGAVGYGELVAGHRRVALATGAEPRVAPRERRVHGHSALRAIGRRLVTGTQRFASDLRAPGMLHGLVLRAPSYGASLESVDLTAAQAIEGVTTVHEGELVAVAAAERARAARALAAIVARWRVPSQPGELELESHLRSHPLEAFGWEQAMSEQEGDVEAALADAEVRLQATYTTAYLAHASLETRVALAEWQADGRLTVWTGAQQPFPVRAALAAALDLPQERVRVIVPDIGGAFGSKHTEAEAIAAALLARAAGAPVKVALSREEEFRHTYMRPASVIDLRSGAGRDGVISAWDFRNLNSGTAALAPPYAIADRRIAFQPAASPLPQGPYRALAATANNFARESHIDEIAHALGADPLALRLGNLADERLAEVLRALARRVDWERARGQAPPGVGVGIACGLEKGGRVATCAEIQVADESVRILRIVTAFDCGAIVNPANLEAQIEGALVMGLGGALFEAVHFQDGRLSNASMRAYRVPRFPEVPPIEVVLIDRPEIPSAGAGETPMIALAPALANAIFAACGRRIRSLPLLEENRLAGGRGP